MMIILTSGMDVIINEWLKMDGYERMVAQPLRVLESNEVYHSVLNVYQMICLNEEYVKLDMK